MIFESEKSDPVSGFGNIPSTSIKPPLFHYAIMFDVVDAVKVNGRIVGGEAVFHALIPHRPG